MPEVSDTAAAAAAAATATATTATPHVAASNASITEEGADAKNEQASFKRDDNDTLVEERFDLTNPIPKVYKPDKNAHDSELDSLTKVIDTFKISYNAMQYKTDTAMGVKNSDSRIGMSENLHPPITVAQEKVNRRRLQRALEFGRAFVKSIMENECNPIPDSDGMSVLRNVFKLETGETHDVVLRNTTIPFWQQCINLVNTPRMRYRVAAIGPSGIGKSRATAILIRMLLQQRISVVYHIRAPNKTGWYYEFVHGPSKSIVTNVYPEKIFTEDIPSLELSSTFYIVDPGSTCDDCNPPSDFEPKVILVTSPDSVHYGGLKFHKGLDGVRGFLKSMPLWTLEELLFAQPILCPNLTVKVVRDLYRLFDGAPSDVFRDYSDATALHWRMASMPTISFFDNVFDKFKLKKIEALLARMICAYLHEKPKSQADFPKTSRCYKIREGFSEIDSYWITKARSQRFKGTFKRGVLYRPDIVDEMMHLVKACFEPKDDKEGIMIKGPHGIGKSHSIINLVRKLLYDSGGKYFVTFIPDCKEWNDLGNLYDAICNSFGCSRSDLGLDDLGKNPTQEGSLFRIFIALIDELLAEKDMKWVFIFDQINQLFTEPVFNELKDISALPFPYNAIESVMKGGRIISIISASANNEVSHRDSHSDFTEYDHCCSMSTSEINAVFQEMEKLKREKKEMVHRVTGGVPLQVANLINFDFSIESYQTDAMKYIRESLEKLENQSSPKVFQDITESAVACLLSLEGSDKRHDRKYSVLSKCDGRTYYKPLFPMVLDSYREYFWNSLIMSIKKKEKLLLSVCKDAKVTDDVRGRLFEYMVINRCSSNANITVDVAWDFPTLQNCNLVDTFEKQKLPDAEENGMYVPKNSNFPAVDLIWKCNKSVCGVQVHIAAHKDTTEQFEALCTDAGWFNKYEHVYMLYLSPTTNVTATMQKYVSQWQEGRIQVAAVSIDKVACLADLQW